MDPVHAIDPHTLRRLFLVGGVLPAGLGLVVAMLRGQIVPVAATTVALGLMIAVERWVARRPEQTVAAITWLSLAVVLFLAPLIGGLDGPMLVALLSPVFLAGAQPDLRLRQLVLGIAVGAVGIAYLAELTTGTAPSGAAEVRAAVLLAMLFTVAAFTSHTVARLRGAIGHARHQERLAREAVREQSRELARRRAVEQELTLAAAAAEEASQTKSAFLASMSHELRTPLNAIIGYAEMLLEEHDEPATVDDLHRIERSGRHLLTLINDVLDLSKIEAGRMEIVPTTFTLDALLAALTEHVHPLMEAHGNRFAVRDDAGLRQIVADEVRVKQVLLNLLSNAAKFTEQGQVELHVSSREHSGRQEVVFAISDTGVGIEPARMAELFRPFVQAHTSPSAREGGTGLGLVLSRNFAEMMDGSVHAASEPGVGSTFTFVLPTRTPHAVVDDLLRSRAEGAAGSDRPVAVCIDDHPADLDVLGRRLDQLGFFVVPCRDSRQALPILRKLQPALVTLDLHMPHVGGREVLAEIRADATLAQVPVILCTHEAVTSLPPLPYLASMRKPVHAEQLQRTVEFLMTDEGLWRTSA